MAVTFVNSTGASFTAAASTWSVALPAVTAGAAVIVGVGLPSSVTSVSTMTDNAGTVYQRAVANTVAQATRCELWFGLNAAATSTRVSITLSGASSGAAGVCQFTGLSTANALDVVGSSASGATSNSNTHAGSLITPRSLGVVVSFARMLQSTLGSFTTSANYTAWVTTAAAVRTFGQYWIQGALTATDGLFTTSSKVGHAVVLANFADTVAVGKGKTWGGMPVLGVQ